MVAPHWLEMHVYGLLADFSRTKQVGPTGKWRSYCGCLTDYLFHFEALRGGERLVKECSDAELVTYPFGI